MSQENVVTKAAFWKLVAGSAGTLILLVITGIFAAEDMMSETVDKECKYLMDQRAIEQRLSRVDETTQHNAEKLNSLGSTMAQVQATLDQMIKKQDQTY